MRWIVLAVILALLACGSSRSSLTSGRGAADPRVDELYARSRLEEFCARHRQALKHWEGPAQTQLSHVNRTRFRQWADARFAPEPFCRAVRTHMVKQADAAHLTAVLAWLRGPVAQKFRERDAAGKRQRIGVAPPESRVTLLRRLAEVDGQLELATRVGLSGARALQVLQDAERYGASPRLLRRAERQVAPMSRSVREQVQQSSFAVQATILHDVTDAELEQAIAFYESPAGRWYAQARVDAVEAAIHDADQALIRSLLADATLARNAESLLIQRPRGPRCTDLPACIAACETGDGNACLGAGIAVDTGGKGAPDPADAFDLYARGCRAGVHTACVLEGAALAEGRGVTKDVAHARDLFERACNAGEPYGCSNHARMILLASTALDARTRAFDLLRRGCNASTAAGCGGLGWALLEGLMAEPDPVEGMARLQAGCDADDSHACLQLGSAYRWGWGAVEPQPERAVAVYEHACTRGDMASCNDLGDCLETGTGTAVDAARAMTLYVRACDGGEPMGCVSIGWLHEQGKGVRPNALRAAQMYDLACQHGSALGCSMLEALRKRMEH